MKFLLFADYHYWPGNFKSAEWEGLRLFQKRAEETGCDMIVHAGDLCHGPTGIEDFVNDYNDFHIPSYHCVGNHETDECSIKDMLRLYRIPDANYFIEKGGYRFIFVNTNYFKDGDEYIMYEFRNYYKSPETRETVPPQTLKWLEKTIDESELPCILISHASFERLVQGVKNKDDVQAIINRANAKKKHSVLMCINGHNHVDNIRILDNVIYYDVISTLMDWQGSTYPPHNAYPKEECEKYSAMPKTLYYNDPMHSIVTVEGTTVTIEGMKSSMYMGVTRRSLGRPEYDKDGRPIGPYATSAKITLG